MRGTNTLHINKKTMAQIVQEWVEREFKAKNLIVRDVSYNSGLSSVFEVTIDADEDAEID